MQCGPCHDYRAFRLTNAETPVADGSVVEQMRSPSPVLRQSFAIRAAQHSAARKVVGSEHGADVGVRPLRLACRCPDR